MLVLMNDITFPPARKEFLKSANLYLTVIKSTWYPTISPKQRYSIRYTSKVMRDFVREHGITNYFEVGRRMGIEHVILPEKGLIGPGK